MPLLTPLEILLITMRERWAAGDKDGAVKIASLAAPYQHARRTAAAPTRRASQEPDELTDAELHTALQKAGAGRAGAGRAGAGVALPPDNPREPG